MTDYLGQEPVTLPPRTAPIGRAMWVGWVLLWITLAAIAGLTASWVSLQ